MPKQICGLLLAAGSASRFGEQKLLYPLPSGETILSASASTLKQVIPRCLAVVQDDADELSSLLKHEGIELVVNTKPKQGIGSSIHCGVAHTNADAWVIALADMPFVQVQTIQTILDYLESGEKIVAPIYKGQRGHPVGINCLYKNDLLQLNDDVGAKDILQNNKSEIKLFESEDVGVIQDIDTEEDIKKYYFQ